MANSCWINCNHPGRFAESKRIALTLPYDAMQSREAGEGASPFGGLLLGRRTCEILYDYWPKQTNNPFTERLNNMQKFVVSTKLKEPLAWQNTILIKGNLAEAVTPLKASQATI